jgi:hypothetical protein
MVRFASDPITIRESTDGKLRRAGRQKPVNDAEERCLAVG